MDKLHIALTELCFSINYYNQILVWEHTFAPKEYLFQNLELRFNKLVCLWLLYRITVIYYFRALVGMAMYNPQTQEIAKPSELLNSVRTYMTVLQSIENYGKDTVVFVWCQHKF